MPNNDEELEKLLLEFVRDWEFSQNKWRGDGKAEWLTVLEQAKAALKQREERLVLEARMDVVRAVPINWDVAHVINWKREQLAELSKQHKEARGE